MTLRNRSRVVLLGIVLSGAASTADAATRDNPYYSDAPSKVAGPSDLAGPLDLAGPAGHPAADLTQADPPAAIGNAGIGNAGPHHAAIGLDDVALVNPPTVTVPRRLPPVNSRPTQPPQESTTLPLPTAAPQPAADQVVSSPWLQSITADSCLARGSRHLDDAYREYSVGAWSSAEASAWKALELTATGIDVADRQAASTQRPATAAKDVRIARTAIREARDFVASGAAVDDQLIAAIASSHQTPALADAGSIGLTPTQSADRYLDYARVKLAPLAARHVQAAQAMDLIAAIQLGRNETKGLPEETSLCLRRAALQGQPSNASLATRLGMQLADMGLDAEAQWTLQHAMTLSPTQEIAAALDSVMARQTNPVGGVDQRVVQAETPVAARTRFPKVIELSPTQFASISPAVNTLTQPSSLARPASGDDSQRQPPSAEPAAPVTTQPNKKKSRFIPASLAGFRFPRLSSAPPSTEQSTFDSDVIEASVDERYRADEYEVYDASATGPAPGQQGSAIKRFFGKFPRLW
ncbi:hypothetical protein Enr13x_11200 [Stieleria neptunia]|uniref:Tetratricopeptide repeat protein n=2 Tax=Stieleria neptunia TaxID=2527979 RepID=A0A518HK78_9BACT|nr:hypothetical protein Enr13x_11200 [Stieleria neptunia]